MRERHEPTKHRELVADQRTATVGEDRPQADQARPVLLASVGRRASDAAGVRGDFAENLGAAPTDWIGRDGGEGNRWKEGRRVGR
jgi:hypothetical protein